MLNDLKAFLLRGNVVDLAVAVIIGAAFATIITALVEGIIGPLIALLFNQPNFDSWVVTLGGTDFMVGTVIGAVFNFLIVGTILFFIIKAVEPLMQKEEEEGTPEDIELLREIRDTLAKK